jgi:hypothetical protein
VRITLLDFCKVFSQLPTSRRNYLVKANRIFAHYSQRRSFLRAIFSSTICKESSYFAATGGILLPIFGIARVLVRFSHADGPHTELANATASPRCAPLIAASVKICRHEKVICGAKETVG